MIRRRSKSVQSWTDAIVRLDFRTSDIKAMTVVEYTYATEKSVKEKQTFF